MANETAITADEKRAAEERRIDAAVRAKLVCVGCGKPMVPVRDKAHIHYCCPTPGCSRMIGRDRIEGWINVIIVTEGGIGGEGGKAKKALRRYEQSLRKTKS